jgi:hypothetical protein
MTYHIKTAVAYLPNLTEQQLLPTALATACARRAYGKVVRVDYSAVGVFVYLAYASDEILKNLSKRKGARVLMQGACSNGRVVHFLQATGWENGLRSSPPVVLTDDVITYDVDCPDAGKGSWENWESHVSTIKMGPNSGGFDDPYEEKEVAMLRCRRWRECEPSAVSPLAPWRGPETREEMETTYGPGLGGDLFVLLRAAGGCRVQTVDVVQTPTDKTPPPDATVLIGNVERELKTMEVSFAKGVGVPCHDDQGNTSPSYSEDDDGDGDGDGDGEWIPPGLIGHHYEFDVTKANDTDLAALEWTIARLTTLISRWGGNVNVKRYC